MKPDLLFFAVKNEHLLIHFIRHNILNYYFFLFPYLLFVFHHK